MKTAFLWAVIAVYLITGCRPTSSLPSDAGHVVKNSPPASTPVPITASEEQPPTDQPSSTATSRSAPATRQPPPTTRSSPLVAHNAPTNTPTAFPTLDGALPTPPIPVPSSAVPFAKPDGVINILLLGNDVPWAQGGRTDSMILISLNRETGTANILSIPRDLYVVIPGWRMNRINLALLHGHGANYPGGGGGLVKDTILYNLGIPVDYYVRIGFSGFKEIVDHLGGVEVVVNCPIKDWRLRDADLDPQVEENWEPFLLQSGVHHMDGELALWYVRSRRNSNDIDRGRRQQKVIRALLQQMRSLELLADLPPLWNGFAEMFETDMQLGDVLELASLVPDIGETNHLLLKGEAIRPWKVPQTGEAVQLLDSDAAQPVLRQFMGDSALHGVDRAPVKVEVETNDPVMYRQVADNLLWYGFEPSFLYRESVDPAQTTIIFSGSSAKGIFAGRLAAVFRQDADDIVFVEADDTDTAVYQVDLGRMHNPCLPYLEPNYP